MQPIQFDIERSPASADEITAWSAKANSNVRLAGLIYFPALVFCCYVAWASFPFFVKWIIDSGDSQLSHTVLPYFIAIIFCAILVMAPIFFLGSWSSPWRDLQYNLSPIRNYDIHQALTWARKYPEIDAYRRAVAAMPREFTVGDYEAMSRYVARKEAATSMISEMDKRHALLSALKSPSELRPLDEMNVPRPTNQIGGGLNETV